MFEKMKGLSFKEKVEYYFQYYGWATLGVIVGIIIVIYTVTTIVKNASVKTAATILVIDQLTEDMGDDYDACLDTILAENELDTEKYEIETYSGLYMSDDADAQTLYASEVKIQAYASSDQCDVIFINADGWDSEAWTSMKEMYVGADLTDYLSSDILEKYQDDILYVTDPETGEEYPAGIYTNPNSELMTTGGWYPDQQSIVMIGSASEHEELAVQILLKALGE